MTLVTPEIESRPSNVAWSLTPMMVLSERTVALPMLNTPFT